MNTLKKLYAHLNSAKTFKDKYPAYNPEDEKIHVLFISPCLNESGYYRMILPALEMNRTNSHRAILLQIHKWDFNKSFEEYDNPVDVRLIKWADYVVLPFTMTDISYILKAMKEINSNIDFVMDMDINYFQLPDSHPEAKKITAEGKNTLLNNLFLIDMLTAPNEAITTYFLDLVQQHQREYLLYFESYPNLLSNFTFDEITHIQRNETDRIKIGLLLEHYQEADLRLIEKPLGSLLEKHGDKIEFILFGFTEKAAEQCNLFKGLPVRYERTVHFTLYYGQLNELRFDIGWLPLCNSPFNAASKAFMRWLDFSSLMVPVLAPNMAPFTTLIKEAETGFLISDEQEWIEKTERLLENLQFRRDMGAAAFKEAWENYSYTAKGIQRLRAVFI